ncbi:MAG: histidine--tRNA ligase [Synechococcales cyanobacterium]
MEQHPPQAERLSAVKGTRDILVPEIHLWQQIEATARRILVQACYQEIRTPILEVTDLFVRGIGSATDVVGKEMFSFTTRGEQEVSLRPENTAGVMRAYIQHGLHSLGDVQRLWYCGPMFRYERPQAGRQRQFHQLGVEVLGSPDPRADAEVIALAMELLQTLGLGELTLLINSLGIPSDRLAYRQGLIDYLTPYVAELDADSQTRLHRNPLRILDSKDPRTREIVAGAPTLLSHLSPESRHHFETVKDHLLGLGIPFQIDPKLVRGLDYYTHTAFEIQAPNDLGSQNTVCGGGRYDGLAQELGGQSTPAVGWALGMERLVLLLHKQMGDPVPPAPTVYVVAKGEGTATYSLRVAQTLRKEGIPTDLDLSGSAFNKQFKRASRRGATWAVIIGDEEVTQDQVQLKNLQTSEQITLSPITLADYLKEKGA